MSGNSRLTTAVHALCRLELARRRGRQVLTSAEIADSLSSHLVLVAVSWPPCVTAGSSRSRDAGPALGGD